MKRWTCDDLDQALHKCGAPVAAAKPVGAAADTRVSSPLSGTRPTMPSRHGMTAAARRSHHSLAEVTAAVGSIPTGYVGHPLGEGDPWRREFMFPLADFAVRNPEVQDDVRELFLVQTRRIADPNLVNQYGSGSHAYFNAAKQRFEDEIRTRLQATRDDLVSIDRLIHSAIGNNQEAVDAKWGGRWNGCTALHPPNLATIIPSASITAIAVVAATTSSFFTPVQVASTRLRVVPWLALGVLMTGDLTVLAGQGGGAKTAFAIMLSVAAAAGRPRCGPIEIQQVPSGLRVGYISAEEDPNRLGLLVAAASAVLGLNQTERAAVGLNLWLHDARASGWAVGAPRPNTREEVAPEAHDAGLAILREGLMQFRPALLVLDTAAALIVLPNENNNSIVTNMMRRLGRAASDCDCAVLLLHHTPKMTRENAAGLRGDAALVRGGSSWGNSARVVLTITGLPANEAKLFALTGADPTRVRRLEHAKINDMLFMAAAYFETISVNITTHNGTVVSVRATKFLNSSPVAGGSTSTAIRNIVMKAIDAGAKDKYGAQVPLSPSGSGGATNERDAVGHVAKALISHAGLPANQASAVASKAVKELMDDLGCVVVDNQVKLPKYKTAGKPDGTRSGKGLATRWDLATWATPPSSTAAAMASEKTPAAPTLFPMALQPPAETPPQLAPSLTVEEGLCVTPATLGKKGIPFMITSAMRQVLQRLGYTGQQISNMTPQQAFDIVQGRGEPPPSLSTGDLQGAS